MMTNSAKGIFWGKKKAKNIAVIELYVGGGEKQIKFD